MQQEDCLVPILGEQSLLMVGGGLLFLLLAAGISFTVILKKNPSRVRAFRGGRALHYVTILTVVFATVVLALERIFTGEAAATILGGIIGYVLGTLKEKPQGESWDDKMPTNVSYPADVRITSIQYSPPGEDIQGECVRIENSGGSSANVMGWTLTDDANHTFVFPVFTLNPGAFVRVWTRAGTNIATDLYWGRNQAIWNNTGDCAYLRDTTGRLIDKYCY